MYCFKALILLKIFSSFVFVITNSQHCNGCIGMSC
uniref:Uncharacterized protein n=1 Tax=Rhizophora mucronata TaxID=61149 RepID=A0A2P2Q730_RHIMU